MLRLLLVVMSVLSIFVSGCSSNNEAHSLLYEKVIALGYNPYLPPRTGVGATSIVAIKEILENGEVLELVCAKPFKDISVKKDSLIFSDDESSFELSVEESLELLSPIKGLEAKETGNLSNSSRAIFKVKNVNSEYFAWEELASSEGKAKKLTSTCDWAINDYLKSQDELYILTDVVSTEDLSASTSSMLSAGISITGDYNKIVGASIEAKGKSDNDSKLLFDKKYNFGYKKRLIRSINRTGDTSDSTVIIKL
jgi:hypothetical protein